jgi:hypothetical protein
MAGCLADRHGADAAQGVVAALGDDLVSSPASVTVRRGVRMELVGFTREAGDMSWPDEMPPRMPPALLGENTGPSRLAHAHLVGVLGPVSAGP